MGKLATLALLSVIALHAQYVPPGGGGGGSTSPGSPANSVQFNNAGAFGGAANLTYTSGSTTAKTTSSLGATVFTGSGLNDLTKSGTYVGPSSLSFGWTMNFIVKIDGTGTPDTFTWSQNNGASFPGTGIPVTGGLQCLFNGLCVTFGATTGHTLNAQWSFTYSATDPLKVLDAAGNVAVTLGPPPPAGGFLAVSANAPSGDFSNPIAVSGTASNSSADNANGSVFGVSGTTLNNSGPLAQQMSWTSTTDNEGGTVGRLWGIFNENDTFTDGAIATDSASVHLEANYGPGGFTTHSGVDILTPAQADPTGTIGTLYGVRVRDQSAAAGVTTNYNIYSEGAGSKNVFEGTVKVAAAAFSALPTCAAGLEGTLKPVNNSTTNTWGATITNGGASHVLAYCDGTNWTVAAK